MDLTCFFPGEGRLGTTGCDGLWFTKLWNCSYFIRRASDWTVSLSEIWCYA